MKLPITYVNNSPYVTVKDACAYLGVSRSRISQLVNSEEFPHMKIAGAVLIEADAIEKYKKANRQPGRKKSNCDKCANGVKREHDEYFCCLAPGKGHITWKNRHTVKNCKFFR